MEVIRYLKISIIFILIFGNNYSQEYNYLYKINGVKSVFIKDDFLKYFAEYDKKGVRIRYTSFYYRVNAEESSVAIEDSTFENKRTIKSIYYYFEGKDTLEQTITQNVYEFDTLDRIQSINFDNKFLTKYYYYKNTFRLDSVIHFNLKTSNEVQIYKKEVYSAENRPLEIIEYIGSREIKSTRIKTNDINHKPYHLIITEKGKEGSCGIDRFDSFTSTKQYLNEKNQIEKELIIKIINAELLEITTVENEYNNNGLIKSELKYTTKENMGLFVPKWKEKSSYKYRYF